MKYNFSNVKFKRRIDTKYGGMDVYTVTATNSEGTSVEAEYVTKVGQQVPLQEEGELEQTPYGIKFRKARKINNSQSTKNHFREAALTAAINYNMKRNASIEEVLETAERFMEWLNGETVSRPSSIKSDGNVDLDIEEFDGSSKNN